MLKEFRYDIAFLRAIAVLSVVLYHFKFPFFHGGYIGVDIFFVISGYLMTKIIFSDIKSDSFNLIDFYKKRLIRIFPAMLAMITIFGIVLYYVLPIKILDYSNDAFSSSLFYSNIHFYLQNNYFDSSSQEKFLLHTWSLSLEWQFYILYPTLALAWISIFGNNRNITFTILITLISFITMLLCILNNNSSFAFFMFPTRAWEMTLGGLAFFIGKNIIHHNIIKRNFLSLLSFIVLCLSILNIIPIGKYGWPSYLTLIPSLCTFAIITCYPNIKLLKNKVSKFIGDISYSWYLWHWPIYVLVIFVTPDYNLLIKCIFIVLTFFIAVASYYLIERKKIFLKPKLILTYTVLICTVFYIAPHIYKSDAYMQFYQEYKTTTRFKQFNILNGHLSFDNEKFLDTLEYHKKFDKHKTYLFIGDSHTGMFSDQLIKEAKNKGINLIQISMSGTFPSPNADSPFKKPKELMRWVFETFIPKNANKIDKIFLKSNYSAYDIPTLIQKINLNTEYFRKFEIPVYYIGQTPTYTIDYPILHLLKEKYKIDDKKYINTKSVNVNNFLKNHSIKYIDLLSLHITKSNETQHFMFDKDHLSEYGAQQYTMEISKILF